jgi:hypothetical protein
MATFDFAHALLSDRAGSRWGWYDADLGIACGVYLGDVHMDQRGSESGGIVACASWEAGYDTLCPRRGSEEREEGTARHRVRKLSRKFGARRSSQN